MVGRKGEIAVVGLGRTLLRMTRCGYCGCCGAIFDGGSEGLTCHSCRWLKYSTGRQVRQIRDARKDAEASAMEMTKERMRMRRNRMR
jgi:hypothetical protein